MPNVLQQKIEENEKVYTDAKEGLEKIMGAANATYNSFLKDYKSQIAYIKNDSNLSSDGKKAQATKVHDSFITKVNSKIAEYTKSLQDSVESTIELIDENKAKNNEVLKGQKVPQIIYVSAMINSINNLQDAPMLKEIFEYGCLEDNFSTEVMNLIYMKANSLLNAAAPTGKVVIETQSEAQERILNESVDVNKIISNGKLKTMLTAIVTEINKYKHDYIKEFSNFKSTFTSWSKNNKYPQNLYMAIDPRNDFKLERILNKNDPWSIPQKTPNAWGK